MKPADPAQTALDFDGSTFDAKLDAERLSKLLGAVLRCMLDQQWRTLGEIHAAINYIGSEASISARLRDLRKPKFGSYTVERRRRGKPSDGLFEYKVVKL